MDREPALIAPVMLGTFELTGTPSIPWTVFAWLSRPIAENEVPAEIPVGARIPGLLVAPNIYTDFVTDFVLEAARDYASTRTIPNEKDLTPPRELEARGQALPGPISPDLAYQGLQRLLKWLESEVTAGIEAQDEQRLLRVLWTAWDCYPWAFLWDPLFSFARSWFRLGEDQDPEQVALEVVERIGQGAIPRPGGRPRGRAFRVEPGVGLFHLLLDLERARPREVSRNTAGPMTTSLWKNLRKRPTDKVRVVRDSIYERRRRLRKQHIVPMLLPFHEEALTVDDILDRIWQIWTDEQVPTAFRLHGQRGNAQHLALAWHEALIQWCLKAPTERRLKVICAGRWDTFRPCDLPPEKPPTPGYGLPPPEILSFREAGDFAEYGRRYMEWASTHDLHPPRRTPPWSAKEKR